MTEQNLENSDLTEVCDERCAIRRDDNALRVTSEMKNIDIPALLSQFMQYVDTKELLTKVEAGKQYIVEIPAQFCSAYASGELFLMQNQKSGELWPTLMKIAEDGRPQVVAPLPIKEQSTLPESVLRRLTESCRGFYLQQQIQQLAELADKTYRAVERIEQGQMDDRIALLMAGRQELLLAVSMPDGDAKNDQIKAARQHLSLSQAQIGRTLHRRAEQFEELPRSALAQFMREVSHSGYLAEKRREIETLQEYFGLYLQSTKLLAASYAMQGDLETAEQVFLLSEQEMQRIDFSKLKSLTYRYAEAADMFFNAPADHLEAERERCMDEAKGFDSIAIEVSGEKLLEAIKDGEQKI